MDRGPWIKTYGGVKFYPFDPDPNDVDILDIARHLACICRFGGATRRFYSVAQHSVLVSDLYDLRTQPEMAKYALLHDAAEAYVGDMIRPIKHHPDFKVFRNMEDRIFEAIVKRFDLWHSPQLAGRIKEAENRLLQDEIRCLMRSPEDYKERWPDTHGFGIIISGFDPDDAETLFLDKATELGIQ